jgi:hypothetical protein
MDNGNATMASREGRRNVPILLTLTQAEELLHKAGRDLPAKGKRVKTVDHSARHRRRAQALALAKLEEAVKEARKRAA